MLETSPPYEMQSQMKITGTVLRDWLLIMGRGIHNRNDEIQGLSLPNI